MLAQKQQLVRAELTEGTGALIDLEVQNSGLQSGLRIWFADLQRGGSPQVSLIPTGLHRYKATLIFGTFCGPTITQMQKANAEEFQLARALVRSISQSADVSFLPDQSIEDWEITGPDFAIEVEKRGLVDRYDDDTLIETCREIVIPLLGAMAELYGYDVIEDQAEDDAEPAMEGAVRLSVIKHRERNPRNRLLCLRIHGEVCAICEKDPKDLYGEAGSIIEVHHLQPVSSNDRPRLYDPAVDLVPLCPNCHRSVHTRRPEPWSPDELREKICAET